MAHCQDEFDAAQAAQEVADAAFAAWVAADAANLAAWYAFFDCEMEHCMALPSFDGTPKEDFIKEAGDVMQQILDKLPAEIVAHCRNGRDLAEVAWNRSWDSHDKATAILRNVLKNILKQAR